MLMEGESLKNYLPLFFLQLLSHCHINYFFYDSNIYHIKFFLFSTFHFFQFSFKICLDISLNESHHNFLFSLNVISLSDTVPKIVLLQRFSEYGKYPNLNALL